MRIDQFEEAITKDTKLIIICNPNNPTGLITKIDVQDKFVDFISQKKYSKINILSDEIYERLDFYKKHKSLGNYKNIQNRLFLVNGFSKSFCMTGFRLGYVVSPEKYVNKLVQIQSHITGPPNSVVQYTVCKLFENEKETNNFVTKVIKILENNNEYIRNKLNCKNINFLKADGGYYILINISELIKNGQFQNVNEICEKLLKNRLISVFEKIILEFQFVIHLKI